MTEQELLIKTQELNALDTFVYNDRIAIVLNNGKGEINSVQALAIDTKKAHELVADLQKKIAEVDSGTLKAFYYQNRTKMSVRLNTILEKEVKNNNPYYLIDEPICDIMEKDLSRLRGFGHICWREFVELRGY